ncbi:right-handed parallel beta-helix repeat-containing protein [Algibacillus agarilyticus]|uniref:right-handed parallel beta-helix repeat-containing protein n=1 Tax=Algibacillus agarilyticus TaxID=2234133 RepID=UPI0018E53354|nr:right-handed parallel beta-helix repeat-containing protein [Algibacillus agarilyticus]
MFKYKKIITLLCGAIFIVGCGGGDTPTDNTGGQVVETDKDKDGIEDKDDLCPDVSGLAVNDGCPDVDSDNDSIADRLDQCPNTAGIAENDGCPAIVVEVDTDKDGIADTNDQCINEKGFEVNNGCPLALDSDFDGIADTVDACAAEKGTLANNGCPDAHPDDAYYVSLTGSDTNDGSESLPFATFAKAVSVMSAGDTAIIKGGTYTETLNIKIQGSADKPVLFKAANGEKVYIKGTQYVNNWQLHQDNIYKANVKMDLGDVHNQVYFNGDLMDLARWPNNTDNDPYTIDAQVIKGGTGSTIKMDNLPDDLTGGYVWYLGAHSGTSWTREITGQQAGEINYTEIDINKWPFNPHNPSLFRNNNFGRLFVFGRLSLLDHAREWYYDSTTETLYFQTPDGSMPANNSVEVAVRKSAVVLDGDYLEVKALNLFGAGIEVKGNYNRVTDNTIIHGKQRLDELDNNDAQVADGAIHVNGHHATIAGNTIEHGSVVAINIAAWGGRGVGSIIENNFIRYFNTVGVHASAIRTGADDVKILKNTISHVGRDGIYYSGKNGEVAYNDVSQGMLINNDGGVFYTVGNSDLRHTEIHHNWFHDFAGPDYADGRAAGIYLDNNSKGYTVHHNVVWNVMWSGLQLNWAIWQNDMYHNTLWNPGNAMDAWVNGYTQQDNRVWNNYSSKVAWLDTAAYDLKNNIINAESPFVDASGHNFMPKENSVLIDTAIDISGFDKKITGNAADVGAYERGETHWTAGVNAIMQE